jgi:hypothetical protein
VHSGFGRGGAWDDEYEGVSVGWQLELRGLKHYLEHHAGRTRRSAWNRTAVAAPPAALWARLTGVGGLLPDAIATTLEPGDRYSATLSTGDRIEGAVVITIPNRAVQLTVDGWNDALYRLWIDRVGEESAVNSWLSTYEVDEAVVKDFDVRMRSELERLAALVAA